MENKYLKYFLIVGVVVIWVAIVYRLVGAFGYNSVVMNAASITDSPTYLEVNDSFALFADYPDPFILEVDSPKIDSSHLISNSPAKISVRSYSIIRSFDSLSFVYEGIISNPKKRTRVAIVNISGVDKMVKEGEKVKGVKIKGIKKNVIMIDYRGKSFVIKKNGL